MSSHWGGMSKVPAEMRLAKVRERAAIFIFGYERFYFLWFILFSSIFLECVLLFL